MDPPSVWISLPAAAAATAAIVATAAPVATATAAAAEARFAGLGLANLDISPLQIRVIQGLYRLGSLFRIRHLDKAEAFRLAGKFIRDYRDTLDLAGL